MKALKCMAIGAATLFSVDRSLMADDSNAAANSKPVATAAAVTPVISSTAAPARTAATLPSSLDAMKAIWAAAAKPAASAAQSSTVPAVTPAEVSPQDADEKLKATMKMASDALAQLKDTPASEMTTPTTSTSAQEEAEMASLVQSMKMIQETMASLQASAPAGSTDLKSTAGDTVAAPSADEVAQAAQMADAALATAATTAATATEGPLKADKNRTHHTINEIGQPLPDPKSGSRPNNTMDSLF